MLAEQVEIDGINYQIVAKAKQATVIEKSSGKYSGEVVIPASVEYEGTICSVESIGYQAFYNCSGLISVTIPNSVTSIGNYAFSSCSGLTSVTIPNSVTSIGSRAFQGCSGLTSVTIPNSVTSIGSCAFQKCSGLTSVTIGNSVTSIGFQAFLACSGLTSVTIPNSVTSIGRYAFGYCSGLTSVTIGNSVTSIEHGAFYNCSGLTLVAIGNSVTSIGEETFYKCSSLTSVTIPNSVTSVGYNAFEACSDLKSVTIGSGVKDIYSKTFANCPDLLDVYCLAEEVRSTSSDAFDGSYPEYATLHVPDGSIESYKAKEPWSKFGKIVGLSGQEPEVPEVEKCPTPVVTYSDGKLSLDCETEGAQFVTNVVVDDAKKYYDAEITLSATYNIEVYATKANFENSDTVSVALVWVENGEVSDESGVINVEAAPVLIQGNGGVLNISGVAKDTEIVVYTVSGTEVARATATEGTTTINTGLQSGTVVIVKFGTKSVKIKI